MQTIISLLILLLALPFTLTAAIAQTPEMPTALNTVSEGTLSNSAGHLAINSTAGIGNAQANLAAVSVSEGFAGASIRNRQQPVRGATTLPNGHAHAEIGSNAFRNASGIITVNQSSGNGNVQANLVGIAVGRVSEVSIDQLDHIRVAQSTPSSSGAATHSGRQKAAIADSAFAGAQGIVQVNQLAGSGNSSANVFALSISVGTP